jgi:coenzyme PQQ synthesis protein D (PqqD)
VARHGSENDCAYLRVDDPRVVSETIDGETIAIDVATGHYYSLRGAGVEIWESLQASRRLEGVVADVAARYGVAADEIRDAVTSFVLRLEEEGLLRSAGAAGAEPARPAARRPFEPPSFERYTDMSDLVLLDPVHAVDEQGWPHAAPDG